MYIAEITWLPSSKKYRTTSNLEVKTSSSGKIFKIKKTRMRFLF